MTRLRNAAHTAGIVAAVVGLLAACSSSVSMKSLPDAKAVLQDKGIPCDDPRFDDANPIAGTKGSLICRGGSGTPNMRIFVVSDWDMYRLGNAPRQFGRATCFKDSDFRSSDYLSQPLVVGDTFFISADRGFVDEPTEFPLSSSPQVVADALDGRVTTIRGLMEDMGWFCR